MYIAVEVILVVDGGGCVVYAALSDFYYMRHS